MAGNMINPGQVQPDFSNGSHQQLSLHLDKPIMMPIEQGLIMPPFSVDCENTQAVYTFSVNTAIINKIAPT